MVDRARIFRLPSYMLTQYPRARDDGVNVRATGCATSVPTLKQRLGDQHHYETLVSYRSSTTKTTPIAAL